MNTSQSNSFSFDDLNDVYKIISDEYSQLSYKYKNICKNFKDVEQEKESLMTKLSELHALIDSLNSKMSRSMLVERIYHLRMISQILKNSYKNPLVII
jgi:predicted nuclease with TOPRIM domain